MIAEAPVALGAQGAVGLELICGDVLGPPLG